MADRELQQMYAASGFEPALESNPDQAGRLVKEEIARWAPIIKSIGLKLE